jgi:hypothetical protein
VDTVRALVLSTPAFALPMSVAPVVGGECVFHPSRSVKQTCPGHSVVINANSMSFPILSHFCKNSIIIPVESLAVVTQPQISAALFLARYATT